jgi:hypothetical protein
VALKIWPGPTIRRTAASAIGKPALFFAVRCGQRVLERRFRQVGRGQQVALRAVGRRVGVGDELLAVAADIAGVERAVEDVGVHHFLGDEHRPGQRGGVGFGDLLILIVLLRLAGDDVAQPIGDVREHAGRALPRSVVGDDAPSAFTEARPRPVASITFS